MSITYYSNIPQATDQISQSQPQLLANFTGIDQLIGIDHATFASGNAGFHNKVTLPNQGSSPAFAGTNAGMYAKINATTTFNELYVHQSSFTSDVPMTYLKIDSSTYGYFYLPNGLMIQTGSDSTSAGVKVVTFPKPFKTGVIPIVMLTAVSASTSNNVTVSVGGESATAMTVRGWVNGVSGAAGFRWMAIGLPNAIPT